MPPLRWSTSNGPCGKQHIYERPDKSVVIVGSSPTVRLMERLIEFSLNGIVRDDMICFEQIPESDRGRSEPSHSNSPKALLPKDLEEQSHRGLTAFRITPLSRLADTTRQLAARIVRPRAGQTSLPALFRDVIRYRFIHGGPLRTEMQRIHYAER
jgi:hypothetical protein